jgi:hypothetical protein
MAETIFMKLGICIMIPEPISAAYFINPSHQSVSIYVTLLSLLGNGSVKCIHPFDIRQRLGKDVPAAKNTRKNRITVRSVRFLDGPCFIKEKSMSLPVYPLIVTRQRLGKHVPAVMRNCFLCDPCRINE